MKNVVIIYVDQLRRDVLNCYGGYELLTPHINSIAEEGIILDECYTSSAVCTPSRGCFMTGRYPYRNGAFRNGEAVHMTEHGFAEAFVKAGYITGYTGKWHLASSYQMGQKLEDYNSLGFEHWKYQTEIGHCKSIKVEGDRMVPGEEVGDERSYTTDWLADETIRWIGEMKKEHKPFLHMVSIPDPHQGYSVRKPYDTMFDPLLMEVPETFYEDKIPDWAEFDTWGRNHYFPSGLFDRTGHLKRAKAIYLGMVKCIDDNVGKILAFLKEQELWDNTIVVFTSDHGEYMGEHGLLEKNNLYDSVYHVPMIIYMPDERCRNTRNSTYVNVIDFGVTLARLAGIPYPYETDGKDQSDVLREGIVRGDCEIYIHPSDVPRAGIITDRFELAYAGRGYEGQMFKDHILFDRVNDPLQRNNLYGNVAFSGVVEELTEKIRKHHIRYGTPKEALPEEVW